MKKGSASFTLIEVMLAVAIFAFAAVGFAVALNDVLGINVEMMRTGQRRQAVESLAARILAASNNLQDRGKQWQTEAKYKTWELQSSCQMADPILLSGTNQAANRQMQGWFLVGARAAGKKDESLDAVSFLLWPQR
jgi:prepilin-type N-terminal cleavage/methylation domain-containing protein